MAQPEEIPAQPPLRDVFNAAAHEAVRDFPELEGRFILVDVEEGIPFGIPNLLATRFGSIGELEKYLNARSQAVSASGSTKAMVDPDHNLSMIFYNSAVKASPLGDSASEIANAIAVIDHELGHIVIPAKEDINTPDGSIRSETQADLFGALRQMKRIGNTDQAARRLAYTRARALVIQGGDDAQEHFSTFALLELADMTKNTNLAVLSPQMATGMAEVLGTQYAVTAAEAKQLADAFAPVRALVDKEAPAEDVVREMAKVTMAATIGSNTSRLGSFVLEPYLEGDVRVFGKPLKLEGAHWDEVRAQVAARNAASAPGSFLIISPKAPQPPAR